ncbi:hypothetical protein GYMLUDRAFT_838254 [Collybiopsis luxurians FD-317 M1]|uniref:Uncharacterized protein n=1 Tax=Collybiopsis luxurians FD-317 M1 TaxID=944289 RepID=A0A0D0CBW9_9AGAR|nr:hypothetical protein GYMLUDRAFT_838254 [Collybiopsis luxurians FD-317 M1]
MKWGRQLHCNPQRNIPVRIRILYSLSPRVSTIKNSHTNSPFDSHALNNRFNCSYHDQDINPSPPPVERQCRVCIQPYLWSFNSLTFRQWLQGSNFLLQAE